MTFTLALRCGQALTISALLVAVASGCGSDGGSTTETATTQESAAASSPEAAADGVSGEYRTGVEASGTSTTMKVDEITDPAEASAPWGHPGLDGTHFVAVELTMTATQGKGGAIAPTCFSATDSEGEEAKSFIGATTEGATAMGGMLGVNAPVSGQLVYEVKDGRMLKTITSTCGDLGEDGVTVDVS